MPHVANRLAVMANSPEDYAGLGLSPTAIEPWEDGARTDDSAGTYEWWYFDAHLADGATLVVVFMNKNIAEPQKPLSPLLRLELDLPDGRRFEKLIHSPASLWSAARDHADVRLGGNRFSGDLHTYRIEAAAEEISVGLPKVVHDWYWARGQAGPYSVIASYITSAKRYGFEPIPIFMLARDNVVIGDDPAKVTFEREGIYNDQTTGKPLATTTRYVYQDGEDQYVVSFTRTRDLTLSRMIDDVKGVKHLAARLARFDGAYLRFAGDIEVAHHNGTELIETHKNEAIWELMYFGHARKD
ncbi:MAG TPA: hypothetical protein VFV02_16535 [Acidimicrobiales bacterium]|nr:hypothetical protein [Acidimicrobiales bacterium]